MRFITELKDEDMLPILYDLVEYVKNYLDKTKILDIRKKLPENHTQLEGDEKTEAVTKQGIDNIMEILRVMCKEYPKETAEINRMLWVCDNPDEIKPNTIITMVRLPKVLTEERWLVDFFTSAIMPKLRISDDTSSQ